MPASGKSQVESWFQSGTQSHSQPGILKRVKLPFVLEDNNNKNASRRSTSGKLKHHLVLRHLACPVRAETLFFSISRLVSCPAPR